MTADPVTLRQLADHEWLTELLTIIARGKATDDLTWTKERGRLRFFISCGYTFEARANDVEPIATDADLLDLEQARADSVGMSGEFFWPILYCARRRRRRPMDAWIRSVLDPFNRSPLRGLFDALISEGDDVESIDETEDD